ncbi:MAG: methyltransferase domain-containing protein [Planctomycetota bacterium]
MGVEEYDRAFFAKQASAGNPSVARVAPLLIDWLSPKSLVDVGCGLGDWAAGFQALGIEDVTAIDGDYVDRGSLNVPADRFESQDLSRELSVSRRYDLAVCLEVAEHLPPGRAGSFVRELTAASDVVLFSAAIPGQGGTHHINEQWPAYWAERFAESAYRCFDCLRFRFWRDCEVAFWYRQNLLLFARAGSEAEACLREVTADLPSAGVRPLVHPEMLANALSAGDYRVGSKVGPMGWFRALPGVTARVLGRFRKRG